jgi:hypothetical protein
MIAHYFIPVIIGVCIVGLMIFFRKQILSKIGNTWWIHIIGFVFIYINIVLLFFCYDLLLINRLQEFDMNNDGVFTGKEITPEQKEMMRRVVSDTARKFSIYTGLVYSAVITIMLFLTDLFRIYVWTKYTKKTNT